MSPTFDTTELGFSSRVPEAPVKENASAERSLITQLPTTHFAAALVSAESLRSIEVIKLSVFPSLPVSQWVTVRTPELLKSEPSWGVLVAPPLALLREAPVTISTLRDETPEASTLVAEDSSLNLLLQTTVPEFRTEALSQPETSPRLAPAADASLAPIPSQPPVSVLDTKPTLIVAASATTVLAVEVAPSEFKKARDEPAGKSISKSEPMTLVISLRNQRLNVYRGTTRVASSKVSSGMPGYDTKVGVFSILEKQRYHHSNLYEGAPMPWMQRLTRSGTALHAGVVPGYPASHGCIRLPFSFAPKLFQMTAVGENVVVARDELVPKLIDHPKLFQPSLAPPMMAKASLASFQFGSLDNTPSSPLRILVTRRTQRDRVIAVQYLLSSLGYLTPQNFTGRLGTATADAIKAFQGANGMPETGLFADDLVKKIYAVTGEEEPPEGHLYVRQDLYRLFDAPVALRNPELALGTHVFTAMPFVPGHTKARWLAISLEGKDSAAVLGRIEIPDDLRQEISDRLTPGSSFIIADTSDDTAILPEGDDFLVRAKDAPTKAEAPEPKSADAKLAKAAKVKVKQPKTAQAERVKAKPPQTVQVIRKYRTAQRGWNERNWERRNFYYRPQRLRRPWLFSRW